MIHRITSLFPLWAVLISLAAYAVPGPFVAAKPAIVPLLGVVMFGMGMTLTWGNFAEVLRRPRVLLVGTGLQFLLMPLFAWLIASLLRLPPQLTAGLVLVGACPGGTASNVVCYLARGDVALSISLTTLSTLLAVVATPLLTWVYVGEQVPVPVAEMLWSIFKIVLLPVSLGVGINYLFMRWLASIKPYFPLLSVVAIALIIGIVVALNRGNLAAMGFTVALAVVLHNGAGLFGGYWLSRLLGWDERISRTVAIEVGMQNSGLGVALAVKYFSAAAALPGALFSVWHNLSGSLLAAWWSRRLGGREATSESGLTNAHSGTRSAPCFSKTGAVREFADIPEAPGIGTGCAGISGTLGIGRLPANPGDSAPSVPRALTAVGDCQDDVEIGYANRE